MLTKLNLIERFIFKTKREVEKLRRYNVVRGDLVEVISGKDKGKRGTVLNVERRKNRIFIENINLQWKHIGTKPDGTFVGKI